VTTGLHTCRHADSKNEQPGLRDHDRNISEKGVRDATLVAKHLTQLELLPDLLLCSNSRRTKQTVEAMALENEHFDNIDSHFFGTLYTVAALDGQTRCHIAERVCVFGALIYHNPMIRVFGSLAWYGGRELTEKQ
jgi:phosphohistidine phosphatase SixA